MAEEAVEEEEVRRRRMKPKEEGVGAEVQQGSRHEPVEGEAGGSPDWAGEVAERTCRDGTGAGEEVQRRGLLRGAAVAGRCGRGREEEEGGWSCDAGVEEEVRLWMEVEEEEQEQDLETNIKCLIQKKHFMENGRGTHEVRVGGLTLPPELVFDSFHSSVLLNEVVDDLGGLLIF